MVKFMTQDPGLKRMYHFKALYVAAAFATSTLSWGVGWVPMPPEFPDEATQYEIPPTAPMFLTEDKKTPIAEVGGKMGAMISSTVNESINDLNGPVRNLDVYERMNSALMSNSDRDQAKTIFSRKTSKRVGREKLTEIDSIMLQAQE